MTEYLTKQERVEAWRWTGSTEAEAREFCDVVGVKFDSLSTKHSGEIIGMWIEDGFSNFKLRRGDWLIRDTAGRFKVLHDAEFLAGHERPPGWTPHDHAGPDS